MATQDEIWDAADKLVEAGEKPTLAAVRKLVGRGSYTTVSESLRAWRESKSKSAPQIHEPVPPDVIERNTTYLESIWAIALASATSRLDADRVLMEQQQAEFAAARDEAIQAADQMSIEVEAFHEKLAHEQSALAEAKALAQELQAKCSDADRKLHEAQLEYEKMSGQLISLREQVTQQNETIRLFAESATKSNKPRQ